ncbi:MAG: LysR family transcriptional regulator [Candidatus Sumerlaeaceae bacterium]|nr:LysR family transcriptional regulator [Candidatus Sumerlaeaceae bacterium]
MNLTDLNFHHILCFWMIAHEGSVATAAKRLRLSQPTLSAHLRELESRLETILFHRTGRRLVLTEAGNLLLKHADDIFGRAQTLLKALRGINTSVPRLRLGVVESFPHLLAVDLFGSLLRDGPQLSLLAASGTSDSLLARLLSGDLDVVLLDSGERRGLSRRLRWHVFAQSALGVFAPASLARRIAAQFPESLHNQPFLMPGQNSPLRSKVESWLETLSSRVDIIGEFDNPALMKAFVMCRPALFVMPCVEQHHLRRLYRVELCHVIESLRQNYYLVSLRSSSHGTLLSDLLSRLLSELRTTEDKRDTCPTRKVRNAAPNS